MIRWNSKNHLSNIRQTITRICFISLEPTSRIRFKNIRKCRKCRKCPAKNNPHERIKPSALWKNTRNTRLDRTENKTRERRFFQIYKIVHGLEKVNWCDENKILRPENNGPKTPLSTLEWANKRKWAENTFPFSTEWRLHIIIYQKTLHLQNR